MLKKLFLYKVLCTSLNIFSQKLTYKEYSYNEFFKMIEEEKDSIFKLENAIITRNEKTDRLHGSEINFSTSTNEIFRKDTIVVKKYLLLKNVQFLSVFREQEQFSNQLPKFFGYGLYKIHFLKPVTFINTVALDLRHCSFEDKAKIFTENGVKEIIKYFEQNLNSNSFSYQDLKIDSCVFKSGLKTYIYNGTRDRTILDAFILEITNNTFIKELTSIDVSDAAIFNLNNNNFKTTARVPILSNENQYVEINNNRFIAASFNIETKKNTKEFSLNANSFDQYVKLSYFDILKNSKINWNQWNEKVIAAEGQSKYAMKLQQENIKIRDSLTRIGIVEYLKWYYGDTFINGYINRAQIKNKEYYQEEIKIRYNFYDFYKNNYDLENANLVYEDIKDIETKRFGYLYKTNPSFKTFFKWRINQFLKVFSGYGKEPERAIIFSMYVIFFFALIYLLFPNSWDSLGKKRLMHRFEFFQKYLRRKEGMHTIYLEDKQEEISSYNDFKTNLEKAHLELPSFFITWSKPLYNASMFSSKVKARFLKTTDVLKGKWQDLTPKQKRWKNIQIGLLLTIGLLYDLFIKVLNALMLSINTFTTLGFGEIPIKGLPRYLAIIQGFIGWFMLTIFSVSLISQLLN